MQPRTDLVLYEVFFPFSFSRPAIISLFTYISLILTTISLIIAATLAQKQKFRLRALRLHTILC